MKYDKKVVIDFINKNSYFKVSGENGNNITVQSKKYSKGAYYGASEIDIDNAIRLQEQLTSLFGNGNIFFYLKGNERSEYVILEISDKKI